MVVEVESDSMRCDIAIVGGGLGGLALCAGLRRRGFDAHVFEAASKLRTSTSTLIGLGLNAFTSLRELDPEIMTRLLPVGVHIKQTTSVLQANPDAEPEIVIKPAMSDIYSFKWAKVQNVLASMLPPEAVHCSHRATGFTEYQDEEGASVVRVHFKDQPDVVAKLVVATDGVRSVLRRCMFPQDTGPRYLGHMNWNALLDQGRAKAPVHEEAEIRVVFAPTMKDFHVMCYLIDAGQGTTFWQVRVQSDQPAFTRDQPAAAQEAGTTQQAGTSMSEQGAGASAAEGSEQAQNSALAAELTGGGMGVPGSKARVLAVLEQYGLRDVIKAVQATPEEGIFERAMIDRLPLEQWSSQGGHVVLLGDAAHAMHSGPGQGGRMAFEDAHQLALAMEAHWPNVPAVLQQYQAVRIPRATAVQNYAAEMSGLESIYSKLRPAGLDEGTIRERMMELSRWLNQYPEKMLGDPDLKFWSPEKVAAGLAAAAAACDSRAEVAASAVAAEEVQAATAVTAAAGV